MKPLLLLLIFFAFTPPGIAQKVLVWEPKEKNPANMPVDERGEIRFHEVVSMPTRTSANVIKRARIWAASTYPSADDVVEYTKDRLIVNGSKKIKMDALIGYQLVLEARRGQYQVTIDSLHYIFDMTSFGMTAPVNVIRTMPIHPYGASADDFYGFYQFLGSQSDAHKADGTNAKKMAITYANQQGRALTETRAVIEELLASLKKAIENESDQ